MATAAPITATIRLGTGIPFVDGRVVAPVARCYISCRWIANVVVCQQEWLTYFSYPLISEIVSLTQKMEKAKCTFPIRNVVLLMSGCQVNFSFCQHKICNTENVDDMKLGFYHPSHPAQGKDSNLNLDKFFFPGMPTKENLSPTANQNSQEYFTRQRLVLNDGALMQGQGPSRVSSAHRVLSSIAIGTTTPEIENNYLIWRRNISIHF